MRRLNVAWPLFMLMCEACTHVPPGRLGVNDLTVEGNDALSEDDIQSRLATRQTPKFLGLMRGVVFEHELLNQQVLDKDLQRVERYYRARGYYDARVRETRIEKLDDGHVRIVISVEEGEPVRVATVQVLGLDEASDPARVEAEAEVQELAIGSVFEESDYKDVEAAILAALTDHGHAHAQVTRQARIDVVRRLAYVWYRVQPGPLARFGEIRIECDTDYVPGPVLRATDIDPGDPYSTAELRDARDALLELGVFSNVQVEPDLESVSADRRVPVVVKLTAMKPRTLKLGGGTQLDTIRTDLHLRAGWEHRNFLGGYRHFAVELKPGVVLYPTRLPSLDKPTHYLPALKSSVQMRQPGFVEPRTWGALRAEYDIFPLLLSPNVDPNAPILGYRELRSAAGVERRYRKLMSSFYYNFQRATPFAYAGELDAALEGVTISYVVLRGELDFRDSKTSPHEGALFGADVQAAGGPMLGDADDVRVEPEARLYLPLGLEALTLAFRARVGFLFPFNYAETLAENAARGSPGAGVSRARWVQDVRLMYFRGFFSGGPNSNRGYPRRGVGPHGVIPFLAPDLAAAGCDPTSPNAESATCNQPLGGPSRWESSLELCFPLSGPLTGTTFCDASDVSPNELDVRLAYLHMSCGSGIRYATPIGPVRFDVGYRVPDMQILGKNDDEVEGDPGDILGTPIAISLGIGEAF